MSETEFGKGRKILLFSGNILRDVLRDTFSTHMRSVPPNVDTTVERGGPRRARLGRRAKRTKKGNKNGRRGRGHFRLLLVSDSSESGAPVRSKSFED